MRSVEIFAGCGGLALGLSQAGFRHELVVERDAQAMSTLRYNQLRRVKHVTDWHVEGGDVRDLDYSRIKGQIDLLSGGPPCQPFSVGGKGLGPDDERDMWPEAIRAVRDLYPRSFVFENVRGLTRPCFEDYLLHILLQLRWPFLTAEAGETWADHHERLLEHATSDPQGGEYRVIVRLINAADYGAAQKRHRAIVMGVRTDVASDWSFPAPTHSQAVLAAAKQDGSYWTRHDIAAAERGTLTVAEASSLKRATRSKLDQSNLMPWVTTRDRLADLTPPGTAKADWNHIQHPGARTYTGHTGSVWDEPAKALKAGAHGVPGGENIIVQKDGSVRYFTVREMARLQGFPDDYMITGPWRHVTPQLGNAVPTEVGYALGRQLASILKEADERRNLEPEKQAALRPVAAASRKGKAA